MFEKLVGFIRGYVFVLLKGKNYERFLNLANAREIKLWNIEKMSEGVCFNIYIKDVYSLRGIIRKTKMKVCIKERYGLPFFLFRYRKRKMFFVGIGVSWIIVYIMSLYIWDISFEGNYTHTADELRRFLASVNIGNGIKKDLINSENIEKALRNQYFDITWASVEIKGTKLVVHIRENDGQYTEGMEKNDEPGNIRCSKNGVVKSIITRQGKPLVKAGDEVKKNDVLIEGKLQIFDDNQEVIEERNVRADGDIIGQTVIEVNETISREYIKKIYTDSFYNISKFVFKDEMLDSDISLLHKKYKMADTTVKYKQLVIGESFYLPVTLLDVRVQDYELKKMLYSEEEINDIANRKLMYIMKKIEENTIQILENNVKIEVDEKNCRIYGQVTVLENIGCFGGT